MNHRLLLILLYFYRGWLFWVHCFIGNYQGALFSKEMRVSIKDPRGAIAEKKKKRTRHNVWERETKKRKYVHQTNGQFVRFHLIHRHLLVHIFSDTKYNELQVHPFLSILSDKTTASLIKWLCIKTTSELKIAEFVKRNEWGCVIQMENPSESVTPSNQIKNEFKGKQKGCWQSQP